MQEIAKSQHQHFAKIGKIDEDQKIVYAVVYEPFVLDTWGDFMLPDDILEMAHNFLKKPNLDQRIDTIHDYVSNGSYPIESFIARSNDPDFAEGAWVMGVKVPDEDVWAKIKSGELSGFSMAGMAKMLPAVVEVTIGYADMGMTEENHKHQHLFFVELDDHGRVTSGRTSIDLSHSHEIMAGTATEITEGHSHRFFL